MKVLSLRFLPLSARGLSITPKEIEESILILIFLLSHGFLSCRENLFPLQLLYQIRLTTFGTVWLYTDVNPVGINCSHFPRRYEMIEHSVLCFSRAFLWIPNITDISGM